MRTTYIYVLKTPDTGAIRYVGKANRPEYRFRKHIRNAKAGEVNHKANWIRFLLSKGQEPLLEVLDEVPLALWEEIEKDYILVFRALGFDLTNQTMGGESPMEGKKHTLEAREKMSIAHAGESNYWSGRELSAEHREKLSVARTGTKHTPETKVKMSLSHVGNKSNTGRKLTPEHRANISRGGRGKKHVRKTYSAQNAASDS